MAVGNVASVEPASAYVHLLSPNRKWYNNRRLIILHAWIFVFLLTSTTNGFDNSLMNGFQSLQQWEGYFNHPVGGKLGLLNAIQNIGSLAGYPFAPFLTDGLGRRPSVFIGACLMIIGVAVQSAAHSIGMFVGARFLLGFGLTFSTNSAPLLVSEIAYPEYRATLTSLYNSLWCLGNVIAAWTTFGTHRIPTQWSWRIPSIMQAVPSVVQFFLILFAPESPRWLISKGKELQGLQILAYYHADGDERDPLVQYEFQEIKAAIEFDREVSRDVSWRSLIATPGNRKRIIAITCIAWFSQWSGNGLVSYYLNKILNNIGVTDPNTQLLIAGILSVYAMVLSIFVSTIVERFGRRTLFLASTGCCLLFFVAQTICAARYNDHPTAAAGHAYIAFIFLFSTGYALAFTPIIVLYTVEILPTPIRAKGLNWFYFVTSVAIIFNQQVNPIALQHIGWKYYIFYCCWLVVELVTLYFLIIETKGRTLEETAAIFDGVDVSERIATILAAEPREDDKASEIEKV